jgi:hypothetical protein
MENKTERRDVERPRKRKAHFIETAAHFKAANPISKDPLKTIDLGKKRLLQVARAHRRNTNHESFRLTAFPLAGRQTYPNEYIDIIILEQSLRSDCI